MPVPTFINVQNQTENATLSHSNPIYGVAYVKQTPKNITFSVSGLEPNLDYDVYIYVMNLNQLNNDTYTKLQFSTNRKPLNSFNYTNIVLSTTKNRRVHHAGQARFHCE